MGNNSNWKQKLSSVFDIIGEILAVLYVLLFALLLIDAQWPFLSNVEGLKEIFQTIMIYGGFVIAGIVGIEAMIKHNLIFFLVFGTPTCSAFCPRNERRPARAAGFFRACNFYKNMIG